VQVHVSSWSLSILPSQILELQHAPLPLKVLQTKERALTLYSSIVLFLDSHLNPSKSYECVNFANPCQEFVFEGDIIEHVQTFKYMGILLKTTPNLDKAMEHLASTNKCSVFALNRYCVELRIMDIKLCCDLFNTLVQSTTSYACDV